jgi:hypothetical protein
MIISIFNRVGQAYITDSTDQPWDSLAEQLCLHTHADAKNAVPLFNLVEFKSANDPTVQWARRFHYVNNIRTEDGKFDLIPGLVSRCKENVVSLHGLVLDVDNNMTIEQAQTMLDGCAYALYTTFSHSSAKDKFRVVIPFSQPLLNADIAGRMESIKETFPGVDNASFSVSQCFYFHSGNNDCYTHIAQGEMINPYNFEYRAPEVYEPKVTTTTTTFTSSQSNAYKESVVKSLLSCSGLHYASDKSHLGVLTLVAICRSIGLTFAEFDTICLQISDPTSNLRDSSIRRNAWTGWTSDRVRRETREAFIAAYGGTPTQKKTTFDQDEHKIKFQLYCEEQKRIKENKNV